jgi:hypothetical protein
LISLTTIQYFVAAKNKGHFETSVSKFWSALEASAVGFLLLKLLISGGWTAGVTDMAEVAESAILVPRLHCAVIAVLVNSTANSTCRHTHN